jgi:hypothetical protein
MNGNAPTSPAPIDVAVLASIVGVREDQPAAIAAALRGLADRLEATADGPVEPSGFRHGGRIYQLQPAAHALLAYVWERRHRATSIEHAVTVVWGHDAAPGALRGGMAKINQALSRAKYPRRIKHRGGFLFLA